MTRGRMSVFSAALTASVMLAACWQHELPLPGTGKRPAHPVNLFQARAGAARVAIRLVDHRPRAIQDLADAANYEGVLFQLSNTARLVSTVSKALARSADGTYEVVFDSLPADTAANYTLTVGLYGRVENPASSMDPGYSNAANRVGEGSATFSLKAGEARTVTIHVNAVGALALSSGGQAVDPATLTAGRSGITLDTNVSASRNPEADALKIYVVDAEGATQSTTRIPRVEWPAQGPVTSPFVVPTPPTGGPGAAYSIVVDLLKGTRVLSRRSLAIQVTIAPTPSPTPSPTPTPQGNPSTVVRLSSGSYRFMTVDADGNFFISDQANHRILKVTASGTETVLAGGSGLGVADHEDGAKATFAYPKGIALDSGGNVLVADLSYKVRQIRPSGAVTTFAGVGSQGLTDGATSSASFWSPTGLAAGPWGEVYVADSGSSRIRVIADGQVSTLAGRSSGYANGVGTEAKFRQPSAVAVDSDGNVYVADTGNYVIRKITDGVVSLYAGVPASSPAFADGATSSAKFGLLRSIAVDASRNVYVADEQYGIRRITPDGTVSTLVSGFGRYAVAVDAAGNVYYIEAVNFLRRYKLPQ